MPYMTLSNRTKFILIILASLIIIVGIIYGVILFNKHNDTKFINYRDPGFTAEEMRSLEDKIISLQQQIQQLPKNTSADVKYKLYFQIGLTHYSLGQYSQAKDSYTQATQILPNNSTAWSELYVVEVAMGDYSSAQHSIDKALDLNPSSPQLWRYKIDLEQKHLNASMADMDKLYKDALQKSNNAVDIITSYAQFLEQKGDITGALAQWKLALALNPTGANLYNPEIQRLQAIKK